MMIGGFGDHKDQSRKGRDTSGGERGMESRGRDSHEVVEGDGDGGEGGNVLKPGNARGAFKEGERVGGYEE